MLKAGKDSTPLVSLRLPSALQPEDDGDEFNDPFRVAQRKSVFPELTGWDDLSLLELEDRANAMGASAWDRSEDLFNSVDAESLDGSKPRAALIFLHTAGDSGAGMQAWVAHASTAADGDLVGTDAFTQSSTNSSSTNDFEERLAHLGVAVLFPDAPLRPYTPSGNATVRSWFDRTELTWVASDGLTSTNGDAEATATEGGGTSLAVRGGARTTGKLSEKKEHASGEGAQEEKAWREAAIGVVEAAVRHAKTRWGIPRRRVFVGGFGLGGAMALHFACTPQPRSGRRPAPSATRKRLGGVFLLSSFVPSGSSLWSEALGVEWRRKPSLLPDRVDSDECDDEEEDDEDVSSDGSDEEVGRSQEQRLQHRRFGGETGDDDSEEEEEEFKGSDGYLDREDEKEIDGGHEVKSRGSSGGGRGGCWGENERAAGSAGEQKATESLFDSRRASSPPPSPSASSPVVGRSLPVSTAKPSPLSPCLHSFAPEDAVDEVPPSQDLEEKEEGGLQIGDFWVSSEERASAAAAAAAAAQAEKKARAAKKKAEARARALSEKRAALAAAKQDEEVAALFDASLWQPFSSSAALGYPTGAAVRPSGLPCEVLVCHGTRDDTVPLNWAHATAHGLSHAAQAQAAAAQAAAAAASEDSHARSADIWSASTSDGGGGGETNSSSSRHKRVAACGVTWQALEGVDHEPSAEGLDCLVEWVGRTLRYQDDDAGSGDDDDDNDGGGADGGNLDDEGGEVESKGQDRDTQRGQESVPSLSSLEAAPPLPSSPPPPGTNTGPPRRPPLPSEAEIDAAVAAAAARAAARRDNEDNSRGGGRSRGRSEVGDDETPYLVGSGDPVDLPYELVAVSERKLAFASSSSPRPREPGNRGLSNGVVHRAVFSVPSGWEAALCRHPVTCRGGSFELSEVEGRGGVVCCEFVSTDPQGTAQAIQARLKQRLEDPSPSGTQDCCIM